jgi:predicted ABC-type ATPase
MSIVKRPPGVAFYGKVRIPTIGHRTAIDQAKALAKQTGGQLTIGLSGTSEPLTPALKKQYAQRLFGHPVRSGDEETKTLSSFLTHLSKNHEELHLVAGSDRVEEYKSFLSKYNGKKDKKGKIPFKFKKWEVHGVEGQRVESKKDPRRMSPDELVRTVSASKLEALAMAGNYEHFKAYHPGMDESHVRKLYSYIRKHHSLKEGADIGLTFARSDMPQIQDPKHFLKHLEAEHDISHIKKMVDPDKLRSSQMEFDGEKVMGMRLNPSNKPIIVSNDGHVLDGHHRWLADKEEGRDSAAYVCDLPILDLLHAAKHYNKMELNEEINRKELAPMLDSFVSFASNKLGIKSMPKVRYKKDKDGYNSFAAYNPALKELSVSTKNRHPMDVFRSVAHELVHHKQNEEGRIGKDIAQEGSTGSDIENEANSEAGKIMRWYAKENPDHFKLATVSEQAVFVVGGPCSGKDYVIKSLVNEFNVKEINLDALKNVKQLDEKFIINASAENYRKIIETKALLEEKGYETSLIYVHVDDEVSKLRNEERSTKGNRVISEEIRHKKWENAQYGLAQIREEFKTVKVFDNSDKFAPVDSLLSEMKLKLVMSKKGKAWRDLRVVGRRRKYNEEFENVFEGKDTHKMEWGTDYLRKDYEKNTPGSVKKMKKKVIAQEDSSDLPIGGGIGPEIGKNRGGAPTVFSWGLSESIMNWANAEKTQAKFAEKYGDQADQKLHEAALRLEKSGCGSLSPKKKSIREFYQNNKTNT